MIMLRLLFMLTHSYDPAHACDHIHIYVVFNLFELPYGHGHGKGHGHLNNGC
jgi:hypothetical protein